MVWYTYKSVFKLLAWSIFKHGIHLDPQISICFLNSKSNLIDRNLEFFCNILKFGRIIDINSNVILAALFGFII